MRLPEQHLKLVVACAIVDKIPLEQLLERLWREDTEQVSSLYSSIFGRHASETYRLRGYHRLSVKASSPTVNARRKMGMTLNAIANRYGVKLATLNSLLEHHGLVELVQYGLDQKRRLVTDQACSAELGHNVDPVNRIGHLEGYAKAAIFPVFYEDRLGEIMWVLDLPGIRRNVMRMVGKKSKLSWLLQNHPYLPDVEIATLSGYRKRAIGIARKRSIEGLFRISSNAA